MFPFGKDKIIKSQTIIFFFFLQSSTRINDVCTYNFTRVQYLSGAKSKI